MSQDIPLPQDIVRDMQAQATAQPPPLPEGEATRRVEAAMDRLCVLVTTLGPMPILRGMKSYLVHERIVHCIEKLKAELDDVRRANRSMAALIRPSPKPDDIRDLITQYLPANPSYDLAKAICSRLSLDKNDPDLFDGARQAMFGSDS